jgi:Uma2 family endonuclease
MGLPRRVSVLTLEEYFRLDEASETRNEYFAGEMFAMAGGSPEHSAISANLIGELRNRLKKRPCTVYESNLRVSVSKTGLYTYPDASVICGGIELDERDTTGKTALNPTLLVEVLSASTEAYDRGKKFDHYSQIPSLRDLLLVSQDEPLVERFSRNRDDTWTRSVARGLGASLELPSIGVTLPLTEVYDKVNFPAVPTPPPPEARMGGPEI